MQWRVKLETLCGAFRFTDIPDGRLPSSVVVPIRSGTNYSVRKFELESADSLPRTATYREV